MLNINTHLKVKVVVNVLNLKLVHLQYAGAVTEIYFRGGGPNQK